MPRRDKRGRHRKPYGRGMKELDHYLVDLYGPAIAEWMIAAILQPKKVLVLQRPSLRRRYQELLFGKEDPMPCGKKKKGSKRK